MTTDKGANKAQSAADERDPRILRTPEKVKAWSYAADRIEHLLMKFRSELTNSRVADDFDPEIVHDLHSIRLQMNRIKQEIRVIEIRLEETMVIEREWWKK